MNLFFLYFLIFASFLLFLIGVIKNPTLVVPSWSEDSFLSFCIYLAGSFVTAGTLQFLLPRQITSWAVVLFALFCFYALGFSAFLVPVLVICISCHLGNVLVRLLGIKLENISSSVLSLIGLGVFSSILYLLSVTKLNTLHTYSLLLVAPLFLSYKTIPQTAFKFKEDVLELRKLSSFEISLFLAIIFSLSLHFHQTIRPEYDHDALASHLMIPHFIKANGFWNFDVNQFVFGASQLGADMLYSFVYMLSEERGVRFLNFLFFGFTLKLSYEICRMFTGRFNSLLLILSLALMPLMFTQTSTLHVEGIWLSFLLAANLLSLRFLASREVFDAELSKLIIPIFFLCGIALSVKLPSVFYVPFIFLFVLVGCLKNYKTIEPYKNLALAFSVFLVVGVGPYLYCYYITGNPVFPFFNGVFKSPFFYASASFNNSLFNHPINYRLPYDMVFHGAWYLESLDHPLSPIYVVFVLPVLYLSFLHIKDLKISLLASQLVLSFCGVFIFQSYFRYLIPSFFIFILLLAFLLEYFRGKAVFLYRTSSGILFVLLPLSLMHIPDATHSYKDFSWKRALAGFTEDDRLYRRPQQVVFDYLNTRYSNIATVLHVKNALIAGLDGLSLVPNWYNPELSRQMSAISSVRDVERLVANYGISHVMLHTSQTLDPFIKEFLDNSASIEFEHSVYKLFKINHSKLESNKLKVTEFKENFDLRIVLSDTRKYVFSYSLESSKTPAFDIVSIVNWWDGEGKLLKQRYVIEKEVRKDRTLEYLFEAPAQAKEVQLIIQPVEHEFSLQEAYFLPLGDSGTLPSFKEGS